MSDLSIDTKKHTTKSRETIPLSKNIWWITLQFKTDSDLIMSVSEIMNKTNLMMAS
jgi:hypothetical protein